MDTLRNNMSFDLTLDLPNIEIKRLKITILDFIDLNKKMGAILNEVFTFKAHVNFAETILDQLIIKGRVDTVINHKRLIEALIKVGEHYRSQWVGQFSYQDRRDRLIFFAPDFQL